MGEITKTQETHFFNVGLLCVSFLPSALFWQAERVVHRRYSPFVPVIMLENCSHFLRNCNERVFIKKKQNY